jgi:hypothetical protein
MAEEHEQGRTVRWRISAQIRQTLDLLQNRVAL